ncbi:DIS3-like exonuclease 2 isoform X2 [Amphiura filiformis]|uniref:DIS3-like exonuclease 2 isoform X2 n=1 Tax=Amphiura filiformis TaxID=82378 RepID=UPI003B2222D9
MSGAACKADTTKGVNDPQAMESSAHPKKMEATGRTKLTEQGEIGSYKDEFKSSLQEMLDTESPQPGGTKKSKHRKRGKSGGAAASRADEQVLSSPQGKNVTSHPGGQDQQRQGTSKTRRTPKKQEARHQPQQKQSGRNPGARAKTPKKYQEVDGNSTQTPGSAQKQGVGRDKQFENYWSLKDVSDGLKEGTLIQSTLRTNPRRFTEAYLDDPKGGTDIMIDGVIPRNRALPGDVVAVKLLPKSEWKFLLEDYETYLSQQKDSEDNSTTPKPSANDITDKLKNLSMKPNPNPPVDELQLGLRESYQKELKDMDKTVKRLFGDEILEDVPVQQTGVEKLDVDKVVIPDKFYQRLAKVVYIIEKKHSRVCMGHLKMPKATNLSTALFSPVDPRLPRLNIPLKECPGGFKERPKDFANTLFIAEITDWPRHSGFGKGHLRRSLGEAGDIETETEGMLIEYDIDHSVFGDQVLACLPKDLPWRIPSKEFAIRKDLRKECIFTIDPATARDLDDALHCKYLGNNTYEVGVHIADVSYFIKEGTALDKKAGERATSVYLVQKVIPMLPELLCQELCSLNPDEDKMTFSVVWKMKEDGEILDEWCGRTVIRSCVKLSYDHAQDLIESPDKQFSYEELPSITNGFKIPQIMQSVLNLNKIALNLRKKRFDDGALTLDQIKLSYALDKETGMPSGVSVEQRKESNKLVEEFMLLANMAVAHRIYNAYKDTALLRRHPPPKGKVLQDTIDQCHEMGIEIEGETSKELQESLKKYVGNDKYSEGRAQILTALFSKPMNRALYFCTGRIEDEEQYRHYALNVPLYTHFTSPIRRYADVIVHRLLAASLGYVEKPERSAESTEAQASHCNTKKFKAKDVQDRSTELFFVNFVKMCGPLDEEGMVMNVLDRSFDVFLMRLGTVQRVYLDALPLSKVDLEETRRRKMLTLSWEADDDHQAITQEIQMFTLVSCVLAKGDTGPLALKTIIKRPETEEQATAAATQESTASEELLLA